MELKAVPAAKSLVLLSWAAPDGKKRESPALGSTLPCQLAASVQSLDRVLAPVQMASAGTSRSSSTSAYSLTGFQREWSVRRRTGDVLRGFRPKIVCNHVKGIAVFLGRRRPSGAGTRGRHMPRTTLPEPCAD